MASAQMEALRSADIDVEGALSRLMNNEGFYLRMLGKFVADPTYQSLEAAHGAKDKGALQHAAHALKGIAANLGMTQLSGACGRMQHCLEGRETGDIEALMTELRGAYHAALGAVQKAVM